LDKIPVLLKMLLASFTVNVVFRNGPNIGSRCKSALLAEPYADASFWPPMTLQCFRMPGKDGAICGTLWHSTKIPIVKFTEKYYINLNKLNELKFFILS
jgi:hypothetical protein